MSKQYQSGYADGYNDAMKTADKKIKELRQELYEMQNPSHALRVLLRAMEFDSRGCAEATFYIKPGATPEVCPECPPNIEKFIIRVQGI